MIWNNLGSSAVFGKLELLFRFSNQQKHVVLCWYNDGRSPNLFHIFYLFQHSRVSFTHMHLYFFCRCSEFINQTFIKASRPNCNNVFRPKEDEQPVSVHLWANKSCYFVLCDRPGESSSEKNCCWWLTFRQPERKSSSESSCYFKNNRSHDPLWITALMTTAVNRKTYCGCNHGQPLSRWWHFCRLSTNGNFPFLEKRGIHFFPEMSTAPLFFLVPTPYPRVQRTNKNTRK